MKFRVKSLELRVKIKKLLLCCSAALLLLFSFQPSAFASDKWPGVDESVVEKFAKEHGREAREPFINTDQGDLLLFVFLLAGTAGGFIAGYYWRVLLEQKREYTEGNCPRFTDADRHRRIGTVPSTAKHGNI
ncbi:MAG: cobalt ABC transporter permease [Nitrospirae bacterium]|nr:cobalt ABC transporter permease [Nitrospirota bacterium]MCL5978766.1 cobalt ABC transporter permease [Nitrospirota bacterium]